MFTSSRMLENCLKNEPRDMYDIVGAIMGYLNADPMFKTDDFDQAIQYVISKGVSEDELYVEFDKSLKFEPDSSKWDEEYYSFARVYLKDNFCRERINHVKAVARKLYSSSPSAGNTINETKGGEISEKKSQSQQEPIKRERTMFHRILMAGIVIIVIVLLAWLIMNYMDKH